jgi:hypothetical protein
MLLPSPPSPRDDDEGDDEERLEAIRSFKRERSSSLVPWVIAALAVVGAAAFVLSPVGYALKQSVAYRVQSQSPAPKPESAPGAPDANTAPTPGAAVAERPSAADAPSRPPQAPTADRSTREAAPAPGAAEPQPSPSRDATTGALSRRDAHTPSADSGVSARATNGQVSRERSRSTDGSRPDSSASRPKVASAPADPGSRVSSPRFMGLPRVELSREPGAPGTYAARVLDPAGRTLRAAEVLLIAHMPDGTVENIRMDYSPDHGAYRGALPPSRSSPTDLRVRVITGDRRVEVPLGP